MTSIKKVLKENGKYVLELEAEKGQSNGEALVGALDIAKNKLEYEKFYLDLNGIRFSFDKEATFYDLVEEYIRTKHELKIQEPEKNEESEEEHRVEHKRLSEFQYDYLEFNISRSGIAEYTIEERLQTLDFLMDEALRVRDYPWAKEIFMEQNELAVLLSNKLNKK